MPKCHYHPEKSGTATCATCHQTICDRCRLNGNEMRCGTCQSAFSKGNAAAAHKGRQLCTNHADIPTEQRCSSCRKPHCVACLNSQGRCYRCVKRAESPAAPGGTTKKLRGTGSLQRTPTGKLSASPMAMGALPRPVMAGLAVGAALMGLVAVSFAMRAPKPRPAYTGPAAIAIVSPVAGRALRGPQSIRLGVQAAADVDHVEVTIDGKYWDRLLKPPFQSDWPTAIFKNGSHVIAAKAVYRGARRVVTTRLVVKTHNAVHKQAPATR